MIIDLTKEELIATNGGLAAEDTPESVGYAVGNWVGKFLLGWASLRGLKGIRFK